MADDGVTCSMSRSGNVRDNAAMESFFSSLETERIGGRTYRTRDRARADVFDCIERFYNPIRRHSTIGYLGPIPYERRAMKAHVAVHETGNGPVRGERAAIASNRSPDPPRFGPPVSSLPRRCAD